MDLADAKGLKELKKENSELKKYSHPMWHNFASHVSLFTIKTWFFGETP